MMSYIRLRSAAARGLAFPSARRAPAPRGRRCARSPSSGQRGPAPLDRRTRARKTPRAPIEVLDVQCLGLDVEPGLRVALVLVDDHEGEHQRIHGQEMGQHRFRRFGVVPLGHGAYTASDQGRAGDRYGAQPADERARPAATTAGCSPATGRPSPSGAAAGTCDGDPAGLPRTWVGEPGGGRLERRAGGKELQRRHSSEADATRARRRNEIGG